MSNGIACLSCGHMNVAGMKFCQECGVKLATPAACPSCGMENATGAKFCNGCGANLGAASVAQAAPEAPATPAATLALESAPGAAPAASPLKLGELEILDPTSEFVVESVTLKGNHEDHYGKEGVTQFYFNEDVYIKPKSMFNPEGRQAFIVVDTHKDPPTSSPDAQVASRLEVTWFGYTIRFGLGENSFRVSPDNWLDGIYDLIFILDNKAVARVSFELIYKEGV